MELLAQLVREALLDAPLGLFHPIGYYDARLDTLIVLARNCSYVETPVNIGVSILEDNYAEGSEAGVGCTIYGAKNFCREHDLIFDETVSVDRLLTVLSDSFPTNASTFRQIVRLFISNAKSDWTVAMPS